jgi:hypothetical protein
MGVVSETAVDTEVTIICRQPRRPMVRQSRLLSPLTKVQRPSLRISCACPRTAVIYLHIIINLVDTIVKSCTNHICVTFLYIISIYARVCRKTKLNVPCLFLEEEASSYSLNNGIYVVKC